MTVDDQQSQDDHLIQQSQQDLEHGSFRRTNRLMVARVAVPALMAGLLCATVLYRQPQMPRVNNRAEEQLTNLAADPWNVHIVETSCSAAGGNCQASACCNASGEKCISGGNSGGVPKGYMACKASSSKFELQWVKREMPKISVHKWKAHNTTCHSRFVAPPIPMYGTQHNGVNLPDTCFNGSGKWNMHHVFVISDWGGILPGYNGNSEIDKRSYDHVAPADHTRFGGHMRDFADGTDEWAQQRVAKQLKKYAKEFQPDYFIQGGDAFYWGGLETHCGTPLTHAPISPQTKAIFEDVYNGPGVDGKQWLGVLGNHDYGGWMYLGAWDQVIGYTWGGPGSTGRWMMPAQYWAGKVHYDDVSVDYYFLDTNFHDGQNTNPSGHNICNAQKVGHSFSASCGKSGPVSAEHCPQWFKELWNKQKGWLDYLLPKSTADWQIVVTHFPPTWGKDEWPQIASKHGIDLIITGHKHSQDVNTPDDELKFVDGWGGLYNDFMGGTSWIVSGGGGGVTSQGPPDGDGNDDQYGFMHLMITRFTIRIRAYSHGGHIRADKKMHPRHPAVASPNYLAYLTPAQKELEKPAKSGCGTKEFQFYLYRAQGNDHYKDENINAANLAGVLYYLHHEVVMMCPRKFGVTRIRRLKVTMRNTCDLYKDRTTQFGPYSAFDRGACGTKDCSKVYTSFGSVVGCQHIPYDTGIFAAYCEQPHCGYAQWYSFPGPCTSEPFDGKTKECRKDDPGGFCEKVTGERDCTYKIEDAGSVYLDELYKTVTKYYWWPEFCKSQIEYNNKTDYGIGVEWWDGIYSPAKCRDRYNKVIAKFKEKYPDQPSTLTEPRCDFYDSDPKGYFGATGSGFSRQFTQRKMR